MITWAMAWCAVRTKADGPGVGPLLMVAMFCDVGIVALICLGPLK